MTGRDLFYKVDFILCGIAKILLIFPQSVRLLFFRLSRNVGGKIGIALRYVLLRHLAKTCGQNVSIKQYVILENIQNLEIGNNVSIHPFCYIESKGGIRIGDNVSIAHSSSILSVNHTWSDVATPIKYNPIDSAKVTIESDVWVGCGARILAGVTINCRSIVAAGAVVTKSVESGVIVGGVPAISLKKIVI